MAEVLPHPIQYIFFVFVVMADTIILTKVKLVKVLFSFIYVFFLNCLKDQINQWFCDERNIIYLKRWKTKTKYMYKRYFRNTHKQNRELNLLHIFLKERWWCYYIYKQVINIWTLTSVPMYETLFKIFFVPFL